MSFLSQYQKSLQQRLGNSIKDRQYEQLNSFGSGGQSYERQLKTLFDAIDLDRSGKVDGKELQQILAKNGLMFSLKTVNQMIRSFDTGNSGELTFWDFKKLHQFLLDMQNSFKAFDLDGNGALSIDEVVQATSSAGFQLDKQALIAVFTAYDPDRNGVLDLAEYIAMCLFLQGAGRVFSAFDQQRRGQVQLDFNQFLYATANIG